MKEFETVTEFTVDATPEQVWAAIATGPGVDAWFMGRNEIEPREGGTTRMSFEDFTVESTITAWEPLKRFKIDGSTGDGGPFHAFEYLIEGRGQGSTLVRVVHSGVLGGDDWAWEYDALRKFDPLYFGTIAEYLTHFAGRVAVPVSAYGPQQADEETVWEAYKRGLGLTGQVERGDKARFSLAGRTAEGVVDAVLYPGFIGVRTGDALYRFVGGRGSINVEHHLFTEADPEQSKKEWQAWLHNLFAPATA